MTTKRNADPVIASVFRYLSILINLSSYESDSIGMIYDAVIRNTR